jgi:hypothetical protein
VDKIEKYVLVLGYVDETLFKRKYWENCPFGKALSTNFYSQGFDAFLWSRLKMFHYWGCWHDPHHWGVCSDPELSKWPW